MSLILKLDRDPAWLLPQAPSYSGTVIVLQGDDADIPGQPVNVPADLLLAVSPLLQSILSAGHLPPAYHQPAISLPSVSCQVLQSVKVLFVSGVLSVDKSTKVTEVQSVFKMLGVDVELTCDQLNVGKMETEKIEEYFECSKTEEEFSKVKIHREVKSSNIVVKSETDPIVELNNSSKRPSTFSSPLSFPSSPFPVSKVLQDPNHLSKNSCSTYNKKFRNENELIKDALEQHNIDHGFPGPHPSQHKKRDGARRRERDWARAALHRAAISEAATAVSAAAATHPCPPVQAPNTPQLSVEDASDVKEDNVREYSESEDNLFRCNFCPFSAKSQSDIRKHRRLVHFDQTTRCDPCGISSFDSYVHYKRHKQSKTHVNSCRVLGRMLGCGKCRERFSSAEDLAAHKNERKHHDKDPKGS